MSELQETEEKILALVLADAERWQFVRKNILRWELTVITAPLFKNTGEIVDAKVILHLNGKYYEGGFEEVIDKARNAQTT